MTILKKSLMMVLALMLTTTVYGQVKLGHINSSELVGMMPETKRADDSLKRFTEDLNVQLQAMLGELQTKYGDFQSKQASWSEAIREYRAKEIQDLQTNIDNFQQRAQQDISGRKEQLYGPIFEKAEAAIQEVAKEGKYAYIFDTSAGVLLYQQDSDNIIEAVKKKLNLTGASAPAGAGKN